MAGDKKTDDYHITRPPAQSRGQAFLQFLYNPSTHEVLGRTAKSWFQIIVFYIILYSFLAGFFAGLMMVFFQTLDVHEPTWMLDASLIGTNPGLGFRPLHPNPDQTAINFVSTDKESVKLWKDAVDSFLDPYYDTSNSETLLDCTYGTETKKNETCRFPVKLESCSKENYGYDKKTPCIYVKVNKIMGWVPECYTKEEIDELPDMPEDLKEKIKKLTTVEASSNIWVSCWTATDSGEHNVTVSYDGHFGFPNYYFPYNNQQGYRSPFIALQVSNLPDDVTVRVSCRLWAKNISVDRQRRLGMTTFEMMSKTKP